MKGRRIYTLDHLAEAAAQRLSVVGWKNGCADDNPKPAAFVLNMNAWVVLNRLHRGVYVYEPETGKRYGKGAV